MIQERQRSSRLKAKLFSLSRKIEIAGLEFKFPTVRKKLKPTDWTAEEYVAVIQLNDMYSAVFNIQAGSRFGTALRPDAYTLNVKVEYLLEGKTRNIATQMDINIFALVAGMPSGSVLGRILGTVRRLTTAQLLT
jgi:hypothetical protein